MSGRLKLRATSVEELQAIATCVQDAIAPPFERTHTMLSFQNAQAVRTRNVDRDRPDRPLNLLTLAASEGTAVDLAFAGGATVRIESEPLDCILDDLGEPWPTIWRPDHDGDGK